MNDPIPWRYYRLALTEVTIPGLKVVGLSALIVLSIGMVIWMVT